MQQQRLPEKQVNEFQIQKHWDASKGEYIYSLMQKVIVMSKDKDGNDIELDMWKALVREMSEDVMKKNAEHYHLEIPEKEFDTFAELDRLEREGKERGFY